MALGHINVGGSGTDFFIHKTVTDLPQAVREATTTAPAGEACQLHYLGTSVPFTGGSPAMSVHQTLIHELALSVTRKTR